MLARITSDAETRSNARFFAPRPIGPTHFDRTTRAPEVRSSGVHPDRRVAEMPVAHPCSSFDIATPTGSMARAKEIPTVPMPNARQPRVTAPMASRQAEAPSIACPGLGSAPVLPNIALARPTAMTPNVRGATTNSAAVPGSDMHSVAAAIPAAKAPRVVRLGRSRGDRSPARIARNVAAALTASALPKPPRASRSSAVLTPPT